MKWFIVPALIALAACGDTPSANDLDTMHEIRDVLPEHCIIQNSDPFGGSQVSPRRGISLIIRCYHDMRGDNEVSVSGDQSSGSNSEGR